MKYILILFNGEVHTVDADDREHLENIMGESPINKLIEVYEPDKTSGCVTVYKKIKLGEQNDESN